MDKRLAILIRKAEWLINMAEGAYYDQDECVEEAISDLKKYIDAIKYNNPKS